MNKDRVGITPYAYDIMGRATKWSWKCRCGEWQSDYGRRFLAVEAYSAHREECVNSDSVCVMHEIRGCEYCRRWEKTYHVQMFARPTPRALDDGQAAAQNGQESLPVTSNA